MRDSDLKGLAMAKGLFTQGICVLLEHAIDSAQIETALSGFEIVGRHEATGPDDPTCTLVLRFRPEVAGHVLVSLSPKPWPDDMGDPEESAELFVAWSLGQFGPLAFPGCLARACEQSWAWEEGRETPLKHKAHIRILTSYVIGRDEDEDQAPGVDDEETQLLPEDYDSLAELQFLMRVVSPLMELPGVICYFNPGGEVLRDATGLRQGLNHAWLHDFPPLDMWTNVRLYQATESWSLMDTVGNGQFDLPDMEAIFHADSYKASEVEEFLRNASLFSLREDNDFEEGDTADGPGGVVWMALECDEALADPPRPTIRWVPEDGNEPPGELLETGGDEEDEEDEEDDDLELSDLDLITEQEIDRLLGPDSSTKKPQTPNPESDDDRPADRGSSSDELSDEDPDGGRSTSRPES
jgi:hypothetical protein